MMRKFANKQTSKRPWKTPSPSTHTDLKSPRLHLQLRPSPTPKQQTPILYSNSNLKSKPSLLTYKNNLLQQKQEPSKFVQPKPQSCLQMQSQIRHHTLHEQNNGYNSYFNKVSSVYSNIIRNTSNGAKTNNQTGSNSNIKQIRETGFKTAETERVSTPQQNTVSIEQKLKKYYDQIAKLKNGYKQLQADYQRLSEYAKNNQNQLETAKAEVIALKKKIQQKKQRENSLTDQVKNLKNQLQTCMNDLKNSSQEVYKIRQQLYYSSLENKRLTKVINSSTSLPQQSSITPIPSFVQPLPQLAKLPKQCQKCRINGKLIIVLNNAVENKMLQISKKQTAIQNLCADLQKLQLESKIYDKPKAYVKKMLQILQFNNQFIMREKIREVNQKYKEGS